MNTADVLDKAADLIWMRGRCTGANTKPDGALCVRGAIEANGCSYLERDEIEKALGRYLVAHPEVIHGGGIRKHWKPFVDHHGFYPPWCWNDEHRLSPETDALVVDTIRRCSKELRERGE